MEDTFKTQRMKAKMYKWDYRKLQSQPSAQQRGQMRNGVRYFQTVQLMEYSYPESIEIRNIFSSTVAFCLFSKHLSQSASCKFGLKLYCNVYKVFSASASKNSLLQPKTTIFFLNLCFFLKVCNSLWGEFCVIYKV